MKVRRTLAVSGTVLALALTLAAAALAAGTAVSVRIEGKNRTLLRTTIIHTHSGALTKGGTPKGACPATTAAGALDVATHHRWNGTYGTFGLSVTSILGEAHAFSSSYYWSVWVNNRYAPAGVCALKLHKGEQLLFAAVSDKGSPYPLVVSAPKHATAGHPFNIKVSYFNARGVSKVLGGAHVHGSGFSGTTNKKGVISVAAQHMGRLTYSATEQGYIRSAPVTVRVS